jgi:hypothetical protein
MRFDDRQQIHASFRSRTDPLPGAYLQEIRRNLSVPLKHICNANPSNHNPHLII